ncbi:MAG: hypothetical protein RI907_2186 [Pseudomonadota bacterium]
MHKSAGLLVVACALALSACSRQSAEDKAKEMATEKVDMAKGIGDVLQAKGTDAAESVSAGVGKVFQGIERGVEKSRRAAVVSPAASAAGLSVTKVQLADRADRVDPGDAGGSAPQGQVAPAAHGLDLYVVTAHDAQGQLKVRVLNALDQEIGRAKLPLKQAGDEGHYVRVPLDAQVDLQAITKVDVDFQADAAKP